MIRWSGSIATSYWDAASV